MRARLNLYLKTPPVLSPLGGQKRKADLTEAKFHDMLAAKFGAKEPVEPKDAVSHVRECQSCPVRYSPALFKAIHNRAPQGMKTKFSPIALERLLRKINDAAAKIEMEKTAAVLDVLGDDTGKDPEDEEPDVVQEEQKQERQEEQQEEQRDEKPEEQQGEQQQQQQSRSISSAKRGPPERHGSSSSPSRKKMKLTFKFSGKKDEGLGLTKVRAFFRGNSLSICFHIYIFRSPFLLDQNEH